ncbi:MAG: S9 family peptidase [Bacteroidota bacterium]
MKKLSLFSLILLIALAFTATAQEVERREQGNLVIENIPEIPAQLKNRLEQYQNTRSAGFAGWDATDNGLFISTRFGETAQIHYVAGPAVYRRQITFFDEPIGGIAVRPKSENPGFLFMKDYGGNETYQMFYYDLMSGEYRMISDGESRYGGIDWANSGDRFAFVSNKRNGRDFDIYVADFDNLANPRMVFQNVGYWGPVDWSPDDKKMIIYNYISINRSMFYIMDVATGETTPLLETEEDVAFGGGTFARDGKGVYYTCDYQSEFKNLYYYNLETKERKNLTTDIKWDVDYVTASKDGKWLAFLVNENGASVLYMMNIASGQISKPVIPEGQVSGFGFTRGGDRLAMTISSYNTSGDVYVMDVASGEVDRWTFSEIGGLNTDEFVQPELIEYPTFDKADGKDRTIPAYYYKPEGNGPFPVMILFHGGPEGQFQPGFSSTIQFYVNELGIAVLAPNVRGSAGYGKNYLKLDNGFLRENSVKDGGALLDWIARQPELNKDRIAVMGGSYGGYMVLAMMTHYNDRLAGGVDIVGISNFVTFLKNTGEYRRDLRRAEYGDERDPKMREFLQNISPTTNAYKITKPMFIVQGKNDPRVPVTEAEQIVQEIRDNGGDAWYLLALDEGHGFRKKTNRDYYQAAVALFLKTILTGSK